MPKKRTVCPFYGKKNQKLDSLAAMLLRAGKSKEAAEVFAQSATLLAKRRAA